MKLSVEKNDFFRTDGYFLYRNLLTEDEVETLRKRADAIARNLDTYVKANNRERLSLEEIYHDQTGIPSRKNSDLTKFPETRITRKHARRGNRVYPIRQRPVDRDAIVAGNSTNDPFSHGSTSKRIDTIAHLADNDEVFQGFAFHPKIVDFLHQILSPNLIMWHDHLFNKPPYNDEPPFGGANRFHQDGFFHMDRRSVTCWIALDEITERNGCLRFIPLTAGYGQFSFDELGESIGSEQLAKEVFVPMKPGDASFHDRWTIHATGPNETNKRRRGWALHYADAEAKFDDFSNDPNFKRRYFQSPDGVHIEDGKIKGNRKWLLISGKRFPGCI